MPGCSRTMPTSDHVKSVPVATPFANGPNPTVDPTAGLAPPPGACSCTARRTVSGIVSLP